MAEQLVSLKNEGPGLVVRPRDYAPAPFVEPRSVEMLGVEHHDEPTSVFEPRPGRAAPLRVRGTRA
jgi:hypothetical protein